MTRKSPLDTLTELSRKARDQAAVVLAQDRHKQRQVEQQLDVLRNYRQDYARQLQAMLSSGISTAQLANYQRFLAQLDETIAQAGASIEQQSRRVEVSRRNWQREQRQLTSFDALASRRAAQVLHQALRREQKLTDEFGNRQSALNLSTRAPQE